MNDQKQLIHDRDWDVLIILDACRYDALADIYEDYLPEGELEKVRSPVDTRNNYATSDWCRKVFDRWFDDTVYVSASARINSLMPVDGFDGREHFEKIVDVWDTGWDSETGSVPPGEVTAAAREEAERGDFGRMIVHYVQPHFPFLGLDVRGPDTKEVPEERHTLRFKLRSAVGPRIRYLLGPQRTRALGRFLGLPPLNSMDKVLRKVGEERLREGYHGNLERVLADVAPLLDELDGTVVITSDHGELLGENNYYGHSYVPGYPAVIDVPWLQIEC